ncbi:MAG: hypothetical protein E4G98_01190 [Promethearchaeota archaeon]|nr:MAG: hypothetical protein E4G98_01190 [Candidatus Lokiarchaeota archaeon]
MAELPQFQDFKFAELKDIVHAIARTKHQSSESRWTEGNGLHSIDHLETHIDDILKEMARRIRETFTMERIHANFRHNKSNLPHDIFNLNHINATQLTGMLYNYKDLVGADLTPDGNEEIYVIINETKYKMKKNGVIQVE